MKLSRRDLLIGGAGAMAGLVLSPVPWKLLGDVSIWTQNFPWIPQPAHGPVETKCSVCTLCEAGCGIRVRMAAKCPVGVAGVRSHPVSQGALCALAFAAHQLNWHPRRLREVRHAGRAASWAEAAGSLSKKLAPRDPSPSSMAGPEGPHRRCSKRLPGSTAAAIRSCSARRVRHSRPMQTGAGFPWHRSATIWKTRAPLSALARPLLDGWGTPGRFTRLWSERAAGAADPQLRLIQIEPSLSRTAARAWRWVPIREGSEAALAAGLARVLLEEHWVTAQGPMPQLSLAEAAAQTGLADRGDSRSCADHGGESARSWRSRRTVTRQSPR